MRRAVLALAIVLAGAPLIARAGEPATLRVITPTVRAIDGITVEANAAALRDGSTPRLIVMPIDTPDAIPDPTAFAAASLAIDSGRVRLTLPPGPPGHDEVRLYWIPGTGSTYEVAARAPVTVGSGRVGSVTAGELVAQSLAMGQVRFEAAHKGKPLLVEGQFLGAMAASEWLSGVVGVTERPFAVMKIGVRGNAGTAIQALCPMETGDDASMARMTALVPGDDVTVRGVPSVWHSDAGSLTLTGCTFAD